MAGGTPFSGSLRQTAAIVHMAGPVTMPDPLTYFQIRGALAHSGLLLERMFAFPQPVGAGSAGKIWRGLNPRYRTSGTAHRNPVRMLPKSGRTALIDVVNSAFTFVSA